jgi:aminoglycoside 3-N-acetyltransferase
VTAPFHYTRDDLLRAIRSVGIGDGDVVSLQVSLGRLGMPRDVAHDYRALSDFVIDAFLEVVGSSGTLVVPTYSYSIGRGEVFEVETTPSAIGEFPEIFRQRAGAVRSRDPMLSSAGIGPASRDVLRNISQSCYGEGSAFHRLRDANAKICTLGISLYWATFRHHIEELAHVPFRFAKRFYGTVRERDIESQETWSYFAAPFFDNCQPDGATLEHRVRAAELLAIAPVGRGEVMAIGARDYFEFGFRELRQDPWLTAKGPPMPAEYIFRGEPQWLEAHGARPAVR